MMTMLIGATAGLVAYSLYTVIKNVAALLH